MIETLTLKDGSTVELTRINNDVNGNPRYVCHFSAIKLSIEDAQSNIDY